MKKMIFLLATLLTMGLMATEYDTLVLQQGKDGYNGCIDLNNMNDRGTKLFGFQISKSQPNLFIANYRC